MPDWLFCEGEKKSGERWVQFKVNCVRQLFQQRCDKSRRGIGSVFPVRGISSEFHNNAKWQKDDIIINHSLQSAGALQAECKQRIAFKNVLSTFWILQSSCAKRFPEQRWPSRQRKEEVSRFTHTFCDAGRRLCAQLSRKRNENNFFSVDVLCTARVESVLLSPMCFSF